MREFYYRYLKWLGEENEFRDVIVSTRIRIARNVEDFIFPSQASDLQRRRFLNRVEWVYRNESSLYKYELLKLEKLPEIVQECLIEKHLVSEDQLSSIIGTGLLVDESGKLSVMLNEEDHFRFQVLSSGLNLKESWKKILSIEDIFSEYFRFAFDNKLGYLTSCITNLGCGLRVSFLVHLPGLTYSGQLRNFLRRIRSSKLLVRGLYGEKSKPIARFYQIASKFSLGYKEEDIIEKMELVAKKIVEEERRMRDYLLKEQRRFLEDIVGRAYGILSNAKYINSFEALNLLSDIRFGVSLKLIDIPIKLLDLLMVFVLPGHLQVKLGRELDTDERDGVRADLLHRIFKNYKINQGGVI